VARQARQQSKSGEYHVMLRGINRQDIFHEEEDYQLLLEAIGKVKASGDFYLYGYCLMGNHFHLLLQEKENNLAEIMKRIGVRYAWRYNRKYERIGPLFQDRYRSEPVEDDSYLLTVIRYIHCNPVKAQIVKMPEEYKWSSCRAYYGETECLVGLTDVEVVLGLFADSGEDRKLRFQKYMEEANSETCIDIKDEAKRKMRDEELYEAIQKLCLEQDILELQHLEKCRRDEILRRIKAIEGTTQRQIARITGICQNIIFKA